MDESFLIQVLEKRFNKTLTPEEIIENVIQIEVEDTLLFTIKLKNQESIVYGRNKVIF